MKFAIAFALVLAAVRASAGSGVKDPAAPAPVASVASQPSASAEAVSASLAITTTIAPAPAPKLEPAAAATMFVKPLPVESRHLFFDLKNCAALAAMGAALTGDALSTQKGLGLPGFHEVNPIARPFVQNRPGAAFYSAASFAFLGGGMYLAHRTNHHKLERILPLAVAGWEGLLTFHNYHLISTSTTTH